MHRLRSYLLVRVVTAALSLSMMLLTVLPAVAHKSAFLSYGDWVRTQLHVPVDIDLEKVLADAESERHASLSTFLTAFVEALGVSGIDAGALFGVDDLDGGSLIAYLETRFAGLTPDALPARSLLTSVSPYLSSGDRAVPYGILTETPASAPRSVTSAGAFSFRRFSSSELAFLSAVQPQGP